MSGESTNWIASFACSRTTMRVLPTPHVMTLRLRRRRMSSKCRRPSRAPNPKFLAASGHKGIVYREPYGVTLIICPFNGPLLLSLRPAVAALSAGNPCMLKLSEALAATDELFLELIPKYFEAESFSAVVGGREVVTQLLTFPFDFIFLTGSVGVGKVVMRAALDNLNPYKERFSRPLLSRAKRSPEPSSMTTTALSCSWANLTAAIWSESRLFGEVTLREPLSWQCAWE